MKRGSWDSKLLPINQTKMKRLSVFLLFILFLTPNSVVFGDCVVHGRDGQDSQFFTSQNNHLGQTFVACQTGTITSIDLTLFTPSSDYNFWIGTPTGASLTGVPYETFSVSSAAGPVTVNLTTPFPVTQGTTYEFQINNTSTLFSYQRFGAVGAPSEGDYFCGYRTSDGSITDADLDFGINIIGTGDNFICTRAFNAPEPVPTLSQWSLLILGLLLLNLGLILINKKQSIN